MFAIIRMEKELWTVGCCVPATCGGKEVWCPLKDCGTADEAMAWIHYLHGGDKPPANIAINPRSKT